MNRILTAGVALAATLGMAGFAMAQGYTPNTNATQSPGITTAPASPSTGTPPASTAQPLTQGQMSQQQAHPANIQQAQQKLKSQGLYNGAIDGVNGPEMRAALLQFQQRNGLPQTGTLDQQTEARLMQSSSNGLSPTPTSGSTMQSPVTTGQYQGTGATGMPMTPPATNR